MPNPSSRLPAFASRPSADLAGRSVTLSAGVPTHFDAPLAPHHKLIGRWVAATAPTDDDFTRQAARQRIERVFTTAVAEILAPFDLADLRVVALVGDDTLPPALAIICDSVGQIDLGWIEKTNVLANTLNGPVAPVGWRVAAYQALEQTLGAVLPVFGYLDLIEELSAYHWDGETEDEGARRALVETFGCDPDDTDLVLPSDVAAQRPDFMTAKKAPAKDMPPLLRKALCRLRRAHDAVKGGSDAGHAWRFDPNDVIEYFPEREDQSHLPPLTLVPLDHFARELDDVGRFGMEQGFADVTGLCQLRDPSAIDAWLTSLRRGAEFLAAAQDLINLDPADLRMWR